MKRNHFLVAIDPSLDIHKHFQWLKSKLLEEGDCLSLIAVLPVEQGLDATGSEEMARILVQSLLSTVTLSNVEKKSFVVFGNPADEIIKFGNEIEPTTIVMLSSRNNTLTSFFVGSVCDKVLKQTKIPVIIVK